MARIAASTTTLRVFPDVANLPLRPPVTQRLDDSIATAGRSSDGFRRVLNVSGSITAGGSNGPFNGPADQWVDDLTEVAVSCGFDTFVFWGEGDDQLDRFAQEVVPAAGERIAVERPSG